MATPMRCDKLGVSDDRDVARPGSGQFRVAFRNSGAEHHQLGVPGQVFGVVPNVDQRAPGYQLSHAGKLAQVRAGHPRASFQ